jgi:hypothetical protein
MSTPLLDTRASLGDLDLSAIDSAGVLWALEDLQGWGSPKPTINVVQRPRAHGGVATDSFLTARSIVLTGTVYTDDRTLLRAAIDSLNAAVTLEPTTLTVWEQGFPRVATVQRQDEVLVSWIGSNAATFSIQLVATDPRKYGTQITQSAGLPSSSGGLTWPITWPITWTGVVTSGIVHIDNPGNVSSPVFLRIDGPVSGPIVTHIASGAQLVFSTSLVLAAGEFLTVDMQKQEVLAQGQSTRNGYVIDDGFFTLDPGPNDIGFQAQTFSADALLTVTTSPAWL